MSEKNYAVQSHYQSLLEQEKKKILSLMAREGFSLRESIAELSVVDNHPADIGSELFERSKDLSLYDRHVKKLGQIDAALERIDQGRFGYCQSCNNTIPKERLEAVPYAQFCLTCQNLREKESRQREQEDRPIDERTLSTPFARTYACQMDSEDCEGEDAWQDVAGYGNADSLQDRPEENTPDGRRRIDD